MIKLNVVAVGKLKEKYWTDALNEYLKRLTRYAEVSVGEVPDAADNGNADAERKAEESGIMRKLKGCVVLLDLEGKQISSTELADLIQKKSAQGTAEFSFVIGGSRGVSDAVKAAADCTIAFGRVTYPHQLMRVIVAEQLYRAMSILNGSGYHK